MQICIDQLTDGKWVCINCGSVSPFPFARRCPHTSPIPDSLSDISSFREDGHYLLCQHRGQIIAELTGQQAGCGCLSSRVQVYFCEHFHEPVLKQAALRCLEKIQAEVPGYTGRTCRECDAWRMSAPEQLIATLPIPDSGLPQIKDAGIVTGASSVHWSCLGALAIEAYQQGLPFAVADHGLLPGQRRELTRCGVIWIEHDKPDLADVKHVLRITSDIKAWWKPFVCLASPFARSLWVDSDAVIVGDVHEILDDESVSCVSTQTLWQDDGARIYRLLVTEIFGEGPATDVLPQFANINSGVVAFGPDWSLIEDWKTWCERIMSEPDLTKLCRVRDQAGLVVALVARVLEEKPLVHLLTPEWNVPADYLPASKSVNRIPISLDPARLLLTAKERHPKAKVVHWLGGIKPWKIQGTGQPAT